MLRIAATVVLVLFCAGIIQAGSSTADLSGIVERQGEPLAGITLQARNAAGALLAESVTDSAGRFHFRSLPAGELFIVRADAGEQRIRLDLVPGQLNLLFLDADGGGLTARHTGFSAREHRDSSEVRSFGADFLSALPLPLGMTGFRPLLSGIGDEDNPRVHGETPRANSWSVNGIDLVDADEGTLAAAGIPYESTAMAIAEFGSAGTAGGSFSVVSRQGGERLSGAVSTYFLGSDFPDLIEGLSWSRERRSFAPSFALGDSLMRGALSWFASATRLSDDYRDTPGRLTPQERRAPMFLATMQYRADDDWLLTATAGGYDDARHRLFAPDTATTIVSVTDMDTATAGITRTGLYGRISVQRRFSDDAAAYVALRRFNEDRVQEPENGDRATASILDDISASDYLIAGSWQPLWRDDAQKRSGAEAGLDYSVGNLFGRHDLSLRALYDATDIDRRFGFNGGYRYDWSQPLERAWRRLSFDQSGRAEVAQQIAIKRLSLTLSDRWSIAERIVLEAAVTFESSTGGNSVADIYDWTTVSPRIGLSIDPFADGESLISGSYERTYLPLLGVNISGERYTRRTEFYDASTGSWQTSGLNHSQDFGYDPAAVATEIERPYWDEARAGISRRLAPDAYLSLSGTYRKEKNLFEDRETNLWDYYDSGTSFDELGKTYTYFIIEPGADGTYNPFYLLATIAELEREYLGLDLDLRARLSRDLLVYGAYTWSRSRGTIDNSLLESTGLSGVYNSPNERINAEGFLSGDQRHSLRLAAVYRAPWDITISALLRSDSGRPFDRLLLNHDTGVYEIRGDARGSVFRAPGMTTIDLHLEKDFIVSFASFAVLLDIFNLSDDDTATAFNVLDDLVARPLAAREPRLLRWGLRCRF